MKVTDNNGKTFREVEVDGWTFGPFALDERERLDGRRGKAWCLTHLPTGYAAFGIQGSLPKAKAIATATAACADWNFTNPQEARFRSAAVKALRQSHDCIVGADTIGTFRERFTYPEERNQ